MNGHDERQGLERLGALGVLLALVALWWIASNAGWVSRVFLPTRKPPSRACAKD